MESHSSENLRKSQSPASESEDEIEFIGVSRSCSENTLLVGKNTLSVVQETGEGSSLTQ